MESKVGLLLNVVCAFYDLQRRSKLNIHLALSFRYKAQRSEESREVKRRKHDSWGFHQLVNGKERDLV
jgi:hypothetical protein